MLRLVAFHSLVLALSVIPNALAGPACAHRHYRTADCVERCKARWGWTGSMMGTNRWGSVIQKVGQSADIWDAIVAGACGSSVTSAPSVTISVSSSPTLFTQPAIGAGSDPAKSAPLSSSSLVFPSVTISSSASSLTVSSYAAPSAKPTTSASTNTLHTTATPHTTRFVTSVLPSSPPATRKPVVTESPTTSKALPPAATSSPDAGSGSGSGSPSNDVQAYLNAHNSFRASHGASPLVWSDELASKAQQWANGCKFQHSGGSLGPYGENLAAGTGSSYGISQAIKSWTDESSDYSANSPQPSHFTQVIWKGSQQLGCAVQECGGIFPAQYGAAKFYVCEYFPAGNVIGDFAANVQV